MPLQSFVLLCCLLRVSRANCTGSLSGFYQKMSPEALRLSIVVCESFFVLLIHKNEYVTSDSADVLKDMCVLLCIKKCSLFGVWEALGTTDCGRSRSYHV